MAKIHQPNAIDQLKKGLSDKGITTRSIVAFVIFGMIVLVFVLSDLTGRQSGAADAMGAAADVNGELISIKDFQDEENRLGQYYSQLFGGQFDSEMQRNMLRGEVMNSLVTKSVASQAAEKEGIYATDAEVRNMIVSELPYFKKDGVFQTDAYKAVLSANRMSPGEFEAKLRKDIKNQRSRQLFEVSMGMTELQKSTERELRSSKLNLQYVGLSAAEYAKNSSVSADDITKAMADTGFAKRVQDFFNSNQARYESKEQVKASHILIKGSDDAAKAKAEMVLAKTQNEDFGKLAGQYSDDPGSKAKKGELGFFAQGQMVPEFEKAAFEAPVGKIVGPVKSPFGYHIIKVTEKKAAEKASFESAKSDIAKKFIADDKYIAFAKLVEAKLAEGKTDDVEAILKQANMGWKETGYFDIATEAAPGMNSQQAVKAALELGKSQAWSKKLVREGDTQFVVKLKDIKTEVSDLKGQDQSMLEKQKANSAYMAWVESFKKTAKIQTNTQLTQVPK